MAENPEVLPAMIDGLTNYEMEPFTPVTESDDLRATTTADLAHINNHLAACAGALPKVNTIIGLCALSNAVCKLIETRRKAKVMAFGSPEKTQGRVYEPLE